MLWWQMPSITRSSEVTGWSKQAPWKCGGKWKSKNLTSCLFPSAEKYFDMKKAQCKEGLDIYKKFLTRMTRISEFLKVAEVRWCKPAYIMSQYAWGPHKKKKTFLLITASGNRSRGHTRPVTGEDTNILPLVLRKNLHWLTVFPFCLSATYLSLFFLQDTAWAPQLNLARLH